MFIVENNFSPAPNSTLSQREIFAGLRRDGDIFIVTRIANCKIENK